jgi:anti-anti-sigma factor
MTSWRRAYKYLMVGEGRPVTKVRLAGDRVRLDEWVTHEVAGELADLAGVTESPVLLLDLGNVEYLTSTTLGWLVGLHTRLRSAGRHLALSHPQPQVRGVIEATCLDKLLDVRPGPSSEGSKGASEGGVRRRSNDDRANL